MRSKRRIGRKRKTMKFRGGDFDDPDTKDFMNSKIEALEQKITELESNMPVQIGYKGFFSNAGGMIPIWVNKNINIDKFLTIVDANRLVLFLDAVYALPNVRGLNNDSFKHKIPYSLKIENGNDEELVKSANLDALDEKYPGLFAR